MAAGAFDFSVSSTVFNKVEVMAAVASEVKVAPKASVYKKGMLYLFV